jgi:2-oxoglutarate dehydrogenase E1 component
LSDADLNKTFKAGIEIGMKESTLADILHRLKLIFCGNIGFEYAHIENREKRMWLSDRIEKRVIKEDKDDFSLSIENKKRILEKLNGALSLKNFSTQMRSGKNSSLEGGKAQSRRWMRYSIGCR